MSQGRVVASSRYINWVSVWISYAARRDSGDGSVGRCFSRVVVLVVLVVVLFGELFYVQGPRLLRPEAKAS